MGKETKKIPAEPPKNIWFLYSGLYSDRLEWPMESWQRFQTASHTENSSLVIESSNSKGQVGHGGADVLARADDLNDIFNVNLMATDRTWQLQHDYKYGWITLYPQSVTEIIRNKNKTVDPKVFADELNSSVKKALFRYVHQEKMKDFAFATNWFLYSIVLPTLMLGVSIKLGEHGIKAFEAKLGKDDLVFLLQALAAWAAGVVFIMTCGHVAIQVIELQKNKIFRGDDSDIVYPLWQDRFPLTHLYYMISSWLVILLNDFVTYEEKKQND